ncbi:MAG: NAD(P)/FAD-dependent oxidoreductase [Aquificaceae bacterium]
MREEKVYDLVIIGAGSGGYEGAIYAKRHKLQNVALIELSRETLGGNCLNRGCIPSKHLRHGAYILEKISSSEQFGFRVKSVEFSIKDLSYHRNRIITTIRENFEKLLSQLGVDLYFGKARLLSPNEILLEGTSKTIKTKNILLATGSSPKHYGFSVNQRRIFDTDGIWSLDFIPKKLLIVGGGVVGVEFAYIFQMYGSNVTLIELKERLMPTPYIPEESSRFLTRKLKKIGVDVKLNTSVLDVKELPDSVFVKFSNGQEDNFDCVLIALGRSPNTSDLGLKDLGIKLLGDFIDINPFCQTSINNIYACGDITSPLMLAHKSMHQARVAVDNILGINSKKEEDIFIPRIVYSAYEIASFGISQDEAEEIDDAKIGVISFSTNPKAMDDGEAEGFVRVICSKDGKILGCHILGPCAGELLHQVLHIYRANLDAHSFSRSLFTHPSLSESVVQAFELALL